jgi:aminomethyltransferase
MTVLVETHEGHGAAFVDRGGTRVVADYGRPERVHRAVRKVVGVIEYGYGVLVVEGADRIECIDRVVSNRIPEIDGEGVYGLVLDQQGHVKTDLYIFNAGDRLLLFTPPGRAGPLAREWRQEMETQRVELTVATDQFATFGVHGPKATEKVASVFAEQTPDQPLSFVRGPMGDAGVTVVRTDSPAGEEGYDVICTVDAARDVFDSLENRGLNAAPFGYRTWELLTLEAGTPLFETELSGRLPNDLGLDPAIDFEKDDFVGKQVVRGIRERGRPSQRLVGLVTDGVAQSGTAVLSAGTSVGQITRGAESPMREEAVALALVDYGAEGDFTVRIDGIDVQATRVELPFVNGSGRSGRLPSY